MPTLAEQIATQESALALLKQQAINEGEAPVSKKLVDDVMNGVVALKLGEDAVDCTNMKSKGVTTALDAVDGQWVTVTLPTNTAVGDAKALLFAQHAVLTSGPMGGQRIDLNGDTGPIEIRLHHNKAARWIYESEKTFT